MVDEYEADLNQLYQNLF